MMIYEKYSNGCCESEQPINFSLDSNRLLSSCHLLHIIVDFIKVKGYNFLLICYEI